MPSKPLALYLSRYHSTQADSALAAIQRELAQCIEKREMLMAHTPLEMSDEISWTSGKIAGLNYAINMLVDGVPQ